MGTRRILVVNIHNLLLNSLFLVLEKNFCFLAVVVEAPASSTSVVLLRSFILLGCDCRIWLFLLHLHGLCLCVLFVVFRVGLNCHKI